MGTKERISLKKKRSDLILILCLKCVSIIFSVNILWRHFQVIKCVKIMSENINKGIVYDHYSLIERGKSYFSVFLGIFCLLVLFNRCANSFAFPSFYTCLKLNSNIGVFKWKVKNCKITFHDNGKDFHLYWPY